MDAATKFIEVLGFIGGCLVVAIVILLARGRTRF